MSQLQQAPDDRFHLDHPLWAQSAEPPVWPKTANIRFANLVAFDAAGFRKAGFAGGHIYMDSERWAGTGDRYHDQNSKRTFVEMFGGNDQRWMFVSDLVTYRR